jgi:hypothetical protein
MIKSILAAIIGLAMLFYVGIAGAEVVTLTDIAEFTKNGSVESEDYNSHGWGDVYYLNGSFDYVSWTHHYMFAPAAEEVIDGSLSLWLSDNSENHPFESSFGWAEDDAWVFDEVDTNDYTYDISASYLDDGSFSVVLASLWGDFYINKSVLEVTYNPSTPSASVPEPTTMLLLGSGLIGISFVGRKALFKG